MAVACLVSFPLRLRFVSQSISQLPVPSTMMAHPRASSPLGLWTSRLLTSLLLWLQLLSPSLRLLNSSVFAKGRSKPLSAFPLLSPSFFDTVLTGITAALCLRSCRGCCATKGIHQNTQTFSIPFPCESTHVGSRPLGPSALAHPASFAEALSSLQTHGLELHLKLVHLALDSKEVQTSP